MIRKKYKNKLLFIALLVLFSLLTPLLLPDFSPSVQTSTNHLLALVAKRDIKIEVNVIGVLDAARSHMISSNLDGLNGTIIYLIDDGKWVKKGEILVRFDRAPFEKEVAKYEAQVESYTAAVQAARQVVAFEKNQVAREVANAEYGYSVAGLDLKRLREGDGPLKLSQLEEDQQVVQIKLKRYQAFLADLTELQARGFDNPSEISSTREQIAALEGKLVALTKRYTSYKENVLPALIESARAKVENSKLILQQTIQGGKYRVAKTNAGLLQVKGTLKSKQAALDKAIFELAKTEIKAPLDGIVIHYVTFRNGIKRKPREGDSVFVNQPILYLPDISRMVVNTRAREVDLHKIKLRQQGEIVVDAYPDADLTGELTFIGALATVEDSSQSREKYFQVIFKVNEEDNRLRPGMTCRISIQAELAKDVVSVPIQAIFSGDKADFCYVKGVLGGFTKREVVTGRQNEKFVEVVNGLQVGEQVSLVKPM